MPIDPNRGDRNPSQVQAFSVREFFERFPTDDACLDHVMAVRFGLRHECRKCHKMATFHRLAARQAYSCAACGDHVYPCSGTVLQDTRTSLQMWFYVVYLFIATRHGVSGKEIQRTVGVTYKTAWRMAKHVRRLMEAADGQGTLMGHVELDEAYVGGRHPGKRGRGAAAKVIVMGLKERGGRMTTEVIPNVKTATLRDVVKRNVQAGAIVSTDELSSYRLLGPDGFQHGTVKHHAEEYVAYDEETGIAHHVNNVESFWRLFKVSITSTHIHVSKEYMDKYLAEFTFRSNNRHMKNAMFDLLIGAL